TDIKEATLVEALNKILRGNSIYNATRFAGITLSSQTEALRVSNPTGDNLIRLNRLLLEDAYAEVGKSPAPQKAYLVSGEINVQMTGVVVFPGVSFLSHNLGDISGSYQFA